MAQISYFKLSLEEYLLEYHPDKISNTEFIIARSEQAANAFENYSRQGFDIIKCKELSNKILYEGLQYSLWMTIDRVIEDNFPSQPLDTTAIYKKVKEYISERYSINDNFSGSSEETNMIYEIIGLIQIYVEENGL